MSRPTMICILGCVLCLHTGCEPANDPPGRAAVAKAGLMPGPEAGFESIYVANQSEVKVLPARKMTYEPLDTFVKEDAPKSARSMPRAAKSRSAEKPKGLVGKTKQLLSGLSGLLGRKPPDAASHPKGPPADLVSGDTEDEDAGEDEDSDDDEDDSEDEDSDEDEDASEDEDSDDDDDE